jgi:uncharacterized repeat protein (TIGR01451 family)
MDVSMQMRDREKERRDSILLLLLILLFGFICIILSSGWALRFAPSWKLNSNMGSNLNPDSDFLTNVPIGFFEPLDPSILTNPAWMDIFLTPGASFSTPIPVSTNTSSPTATNIVVTTVTNAPANTPVPTNTLIFFPSPSSTPKPKPPIITPTKTPTPPSPAADLQVTKTDGVTTYTPGGTLTYTVTIANNGPTNVVGAFVRDNIPGKITSWSWACTSQTGGATGCSAVAGSTTNFTDTVNLPNGASIVYTVTANISAGATGNLTNTATITVPPGYTDPTPGNNSATDTDTQVGSADLQATKTDGVATYTAGGALTYTVTVTNNGTSNVIGATVTDNIPAQVATWAWACTSQTGGAAGCTPAGSSSANFSDVVDLPVGGSIVYTVTANISAGAAGNLSNTASINVPAGYTDPVPGNNAASDTDTPVLAADLSITKTDNAAEYAPNISIQYTIVASNPAGPSNVTGATVTDNFSANLNLTGITWTCAGSGGASCTAVGANDINDTVNLPVGGSVQYTVSATVIGAPAGNLSNTATITAPAGVTDSNPGNNSATDVDTLIVPDPTPGEIGTGPDGVVFVVPSGTYITLQFGTPLVVGGHPSWDLVYYELPQGTNPGVMMDVVIIQVGDGQNWYTVLNWGDGAADTNANISIPLAVPPNPTDCVGEPDNCEIDASLLYNATGIAIQLDGVVPPGTYPYIRIFSPAAPPDTDGGVEVDGIEILP